MEGQPIETGEPREFHVLDAIIGVITRPARTLRRIALIRPWPQALAVYIGIAVLEGLTSLTLPRSSFEPSTAGAPTLGTGAELFLQTITTPTFLFGSTLVLNPLALLLETGVLFLVARLLGGRDPFSGLLSTFAFASVPLLIMEPVTAVLNLGGSAMADGMVRGLLSFAAGIWVLVLQVLAIRESFSFSTGRAVAVFLIPFAVIVLLSCAGGLLIASLVLNAVNGQ